MSKRAASIPGGRASILGGRISKASSEGCSKPGSAGFQPASDLRMDLRYADSTYCRLENDSESQPTRITAAVSGLAEDCDVSVRIVSNKAILQRNRYGRLPLYWTVAEGELFFSSHCKELANRVPRLNNQINQEAFYAYACFSFVPAPLSPFAQIHALAAGSTLVFTFSNTAVGKNEIQEPEILFEDSWEELASTTLVSEHELIAQLQEYLLAATEQQCRDLQNQKVAVFLSGGLDSALTAAALKMSGANVTAYSLDFGSYGKSELPLATQTAEHLQIPMVTVPCSPKDVRRTLQKTSSALDTAFGDGVTVPLYLLCQAAAADGHKVAFNGEGGDQLFGGWTNKPLIASAVYGKSADTTERDCELDQLCQNYLSTFHKIYGSENRVLAPVLDRARKEFDLRRYLARALGGQESASLMHRLRRANLMLKGAQNIQPRASYLALQHGLKLRTIFCNDALAEFTFTLQPELLLRGACEKYILKRAVENWLPESVVHQEKRGMGVPLTEWCTGPLWTELGRYLNPKRLESSPYWQKDIAEKLALSQVNGAWQGRRIGEILWLILNWEIWLSITQEEPARGYNPFWPPVLFLKLRKEVFDNA